MLLFFLIAVFVYYCGYLEELLYSSLFRIIVLSVQVRQDDGHYTWCIRRQLGSIRHDDIGDDLRL